ncbi:hypothetical protein JQX13_52565 [Archangium violaceum]|uniref:hypothetical protein n=1 Tax=Archangium violaceum TaxID=83451 RepID=UPI00193B7499|nr:hypothetical protein [Archangium violaceum]QRK08454.1 hypothetical protein JQX13_52565 [Archangium violaceum]
MAKKMEKFESPGLELKDEIEFQQRVWRLERVVWVFIALLLIAALLGVFGNGPLSHTVLLQGPLALEYERFERILAPSLLRLHLQPDAAEGRVEVWFERKYLETFQVQRIVPLPEEERAEADRLVFVFRAPPRERATAVSFYVIPLKPGLRRGRTGVVGGPELSFWQFVHP